MATGHLTHCCNVCSTSGGRSHGRRCDKSPTVPPMPPGALRGHIEPDPQDVLLENVEMSDFFHSLNVEPAEESAGDIDRPSSSRPVRAVARSTRPSLEPLPATHGSGSDGQASAETFPTSQPHSTPRSGSTRKNTYMYILSPRSERTSKYAYTLSPRSESIRNKAYILSPRNESTRKNTYILPPRRLEARKKACKILNVFYDAFRSCSKQAP